jgi:hypothetical protein
MRHCSRLTATLTGALILSAQAGCALTPEAGGVDGPSFVPVYDASLTAAPAPIYPFAAGSAAWPANYVESHGSGPGAAVDEEIPRYSNTFVAETREGKPAGLFVSADYYDWGGYPIYYPYPYTLVSRPFGYKPTGSYGYWPRDYNNYDGYRSGATAAAPPTYSDSGPVSSKGVDVTGGVASGSGGASGAYGAGQVRGSQGGDTGYSRGYRGSGKSSGRGYRGGRRGISGSNGVSRGRAGATWRSQPP